MKSAKIALLSVLPWASVMLSAGSFTPVWYTDETGAIQFYLSDGETKLPDGFTFNVGVFSGAVDFSQYGTLAAAFISLNAVSTDPDIDGWNNNLIDTGVGGSSYTLFFDDNSGYPAGASAGDQVYVWGYNNQAATTGSEWIVITNPSWVLLELVAGASADSAQWTITDAGTQYLIGTIEGNKVVAASVSAVPEPATWAAIFGVCTLGFALWRRRSIAGS
ncbi:PEP-CTERM putative exosortase interaction domain-containing protein [Opitutaceae bacterium TAV1]|nr:PEP-CTERM putative exosortase interaction domain-containing protein [Opitutaceae bacterium TAV1]